jgi:Fe-S-cluster-containing dehydrogenase component
MCFDRSSEGLKPMCASVCPTGAISFGRYEDIVPLRRTKPVNAHIFGKQKVETRVYLMLPTEDDHVEVDGCGVFEGHIKTVGQQPVKESWIDIQVEESDKSNEF